MAKKKIETNSDSETKRDFTQFSKEIEEI